MVDLYQRFTDFAVADDVPLSGFGFAARSQTAWSSFFASRYEYVKSLSARSIG